MSARGSQKKEHHQHRFQVITTYFPLPLSWRGISWLPRCVLCNVQIRACLSKKPQVLQFVAESLSEQPDQFECFVWFVETTINCVGVMLNWWEELEKSQCRAEIRSAKAKAVYCQLWWPRPRLMTAYRGALRWDFTPCIRCNLPTSAGKRQRNDRFTNEGADGRQGVV